MNFKKIFTLSVLLFVCALFVQAAHAEVATSTKGQKIEVLSPSGKGGEELFKRGEKIYYTYTLAKNSKKLEVSLYGGPKNETVYKVKKYDGWGTNKKVISAKDTAKLVPGQYGLLICDYTEDKNDPVCDSSDGVITITDDTALEVATSTPKEQQITIISPNGGETYNRGDKIMYTYKLKTNSKNLVVKLLDDSTSQVVYEVKRYDGWGTNTKVIDNDATAKISAGNYRLQICDMSEKKPVCDMSDSYISIIGKNQTDSSKKIEIITPKKNIVAKRNTEVKFSYRTLDNNIKAVDLYLISENNKAVYAMAKNYATSSTFSFAAGLDVSVGTSTTSEVKNGTYIVMACPAGTAARSADCASFKVEITGTDSVINLVKPKGNESFKIGSALPVEFTTNTIGTYQINLATSTKGAGELYPLGKIKADNPGKVQTKWIIPTNTVEGTYYVFVELLDTNNSCLNTCASVQSESFSVVSRNATSSSSRTINASTTDADNSDGTYGDKQKQEERKKVREEETTDNTGVIKGSPTDACKNIPGDQAGIPTGYTNVGVKVSGNCKKIDAKDENSEPVKEERKNQEQKIEKICQILQTKITNGRAQTKETEWKTVKCDGDAFQNAKPKDRRTQTKNVEKGAQSASETSYSSSLQLESGFTHEFVKAIQKYLNSNGYMVNQKEGEPGSKGYESDYFGEKTKQALIKFQKDKGITPAQGYFGPKTRAAMGI